MLVRIQTVFKINIGLGFPTLVLAFLRPKGVAFPVLKPGYLSLYKKGELRQNAEVKSEKNSHGKKKEYSVTVTAAMIQERNRKDGEIR